MTPTFVMFLVIIGLLALVNIPLAITVAVLLAALMLWGASAPTRPTRRPRGRR